MILITWKKSLIANFTIWFADFLTSYPQAGFLTDAANFSLGSIGADSDWSSLKPR